MASTSETTRARKKAISRDADATTSNLLNFSSSEESDNDVVTSDFSSDEEISSDQPGTSAVSRGVFTSYGRDVLPPAQRRVDFRPQRDPGINLGMTLRSRAHRLTRALDFFFCLFFTAEVICAICLNTNKYAWAHILEKQTYSEKDGSWKEVTPEEMMMFIGLLIGGGKQHHSDLVNIG
ncbi:hypothetical protein HPB51_025520 [Rhipicephalus microplus]|uniref:PiggyBac transposable element-derived protein domain-containing protein n=1 Tax=Rhipicephalus microplus TaxID=6941 RepID=A0A9J6DDR2_RHIMP|nr:hypothetical protein HPB51_025520 [Rhipicephalus microplus]